jgi:hypothetical protein
MSEAPVDNGNLPASPKSGDQRRQWQHLKQIYGR